ncbi:hypothetical protein Tsubulata_006954, partial [Turnera subulata]
DIPKDLLKTIVAKLASKSFMDFMNAKQTSKEFLEAANDRIFQREERRIWAPTFDESSQEMTYWCNPC